MITKLPKAIDEADLIQYIQVIIDRQLDDDPPLVNHMQYGSKRCKAIVRFSDEASLDLYLQRYSQHKVGSSAVKVVKCRCDAVFSRKAANQSAPQKREIGDGDMDKSEAANYARGFHDYLCKYPDQMEAARDRDRAGQILAVYLGYLPTRKQEATIIEVILMSSC